MTCMDWLRNFMNGQGPMPCKYVTRSAKAADFTRKDLRAARTRLGVRTMAEKDPDTGEASWYWELPKEA